MVMMPALSSILSPMFGRTFAQLFLAPPECDVPDPFKRGEVGHLLIHAA
jgi:hypothetical protein